MNAVVARSLALGSALAILAVIRIASFWPLGDSPVDGGLRLSWSARPEQLEECRQLSDEELAALPAHMRLRIACEGRSARYLLSLSVDGVPLVADTLRGGGLRNDRPIHVLRDYSIAPGLRRVQLGLNRVDSLPAQSSDSQSAVDTSILGDRGSREVEERRRRAAEALPAHVALDTTLLFVRGRVLLITYDDERKRLALSSPR